MAVTRSVLYIRDSTVLQIWYGKRNPATGVYYDSTSITAASITLYDSAGSVLTGPSAMTFVSNLRGYRFNWTYGGALSGQDVIYAYVTPTRAGGVAAALVPDEVVPIDLSDIQQRLDEAAATIPSAAPSAAAVADAVWDEATSGHVAAGSFGKLEADTNATALETEQDVDDLQADFNSFEVINQAEHDQTQSQISLVGAASEAQLLGPATFPIPDSGSDTFVLEFVLKDLDTSPVALVDPDSNQVDISVIDESAGTPTGVTLGGSPAGRMTRTSTGLYTLIVTVASTAVDTTQLRFTAAYARSAVANVAKWISQLGDFDQLDTIESQVNAIRNTDVPLITSKEDAIKAVVDAIRATDIPLVTSKEDLIKAVVDAIRATDVPAIQANVDDVDSDLAALQADFDAFEVTNQGEHDATQVSILTRESEASAASRATTDQTEHDATQAAIAAIPATDLTPVISRLDNATYGLSALNADLDTILARLGITTDTGGTTTTGTAMAKLNRLMTTLSDAAHSDIVPGGTTLAEA